MVRSLCADALDGAERVRSIVRDLHTFSRGEEERTGPVDVEKVLDSSINVAMNHIRPRARLVRDYQPLLPVLADESRIGQVSVECIHSHVPLHLLSLLQGKDVLVGVIDVATDKIETPQQVEQVIAEVMKYVPKDKIVACTNCGMAPMRRDIAEAKLIALGKGVALARKKFG